MPQHGVLVADTDAFGHQLPCRLEVCQEFAFLLPYNKDSFLKDPLTHIGLVDSFGRKHWSSRRDAKAAKERYSRDYLQREASDRPG